MGVRAKRRWPTCALLVLTAILCFHTVRAQVIDVAVVHGTSMEPTISDGALVLIDRLSSPQPGNVIVLRPPGDWDAPNTYIVKRVISVGGHQVACCTTQGQVAVDAVALDEPYTLNAFVAPRSFDRYVATGFLWVLGDNRAQSDDSSRHLNAIDGGAVQTDRVVGVVRGWSNP